MRQVPHYLLVGDGRVANHMRVYLNILAISFSNWKRLDGIEALNRFASKASHILVLIADKAIEPFIIKHLTHFSGTILHFSGSLITPFAIGTHPLMTFGHQFYSLNTYQQIPFVIEKNSLNFSQLLPGLSNPAIYLPKELKAKYHALCVMSGNFSCLLWQRFFHQLSTEFNIPKDFLKPYLLQQTRNLLENVETALTGPLVRNDKETIRNNLEALKDDPLQSLYQAFINYYQTINSEPA